MLGLVLAAIVIGCLVQFYLPFCLDRAESMELANWTKKQDVDVAELGTSSLAPTSLPPKPPITNKLLYNTSTITKRVSSTIKKHIGINQSESTNNITKQETKWIISPESQAIVDKYRNTLSISLYFKIILDGLFFISTLAYPPLLWIAWSFFPNNSTTVLAILFCGTKFFFTIFILFGVDLSCDKWAYKLNSIPKDEYEFKRELRTLVTIGFLWSLFLVAYLFLRALFIYIQSGLLFLDGWILLMVYGFVDLLFFVFPFTLL